MISIMYTLGRARWCHLNDPALKPEKIAVMSRLKNLAVAFGVASFAALAGCQTASLEDAAPTTAPPTAEGAQTSNVATDNNIRVISPVPIPGRSVDEVQRQQFVDDRIAQAGAYPAVGLDREAAMAQMSPSQAQALRQEFSQYRGGAKAGGSTDAEYRRRLAELRRTAQTHAEDAEKEIEN